MILGAAILAAAYLLEGTVPWMSGLLPSFAWVVAEIMRGIGWTFIIVAREAWISDETDPSQLGGLLLRAGKLDRAMSMIGIGLSEVLATLSLNLPFLVGGLSRGLLALVLWRFKSEVHFTRTPGADHPTRQNSGRTFSKGVRLARGRPTLIALLALAVIGGAASEH